MTGGLQVPPDLGIPDSTQTQLQQFWELASAYADHYLRQLGFTPMAQPTVPFPHITVQDYKNIEGEQYTELMATVDIWFSYAKEQHAVFEGSILALEEELKDLEREMKKTHRESTRLLPPKQQPTETELKESAKSHPRCRNIEHQLTTLRKADLLIKARIDSCERLAAGLSRQITIRGQEWKVGDARSRATGPGRFT